MRKVGLATPHWPREWGGAELSLRHQVLIFEEIARINAPNPDLFVISLYHLPATLFGHGSQAQRDRYLTGVKERGEIWCQGFSEPNAGSDLASLRTRAERKGDVYVVNGQKVWSSYGLFADYCLLLARTNPDAPKKQAGISYFILDMKAPGVTVRADPPGDRPGGVLRDLPRQRGDPRREPDRRGEPGLDRSPSPPSRPSAA